MDRVLREFMEVLDEFGELLVHTWNQGTPEIRRQMLDIARGEHVPSETEVDECLRSMEKSA